MVKTSGDYRPVALGLKSSLYDIALELKVIGNPCTDDIRASRARRCEMIRTLSLGVALG
jgi:hypothetical protein